MAPCRKCIHGSRAMSQEVSSRAKTGRLSCQLVGSICLAALLLTAAMWMNAVLVLEKYCASILAIRGCIHASSSFEQNDVWNELHAVIRQPSVCFQPEVL